MSILSRSKNASFATLLRILFALSAISATTAAAEIKGYCPFQYPEFYQFACYGYALNNSGTVVGAERGLDGNYAIANGDILSCKSGQCVAATGVNDYGDIVGLGIADAGVPMIRPRALRALFSTPAVE